VTLALAAVLEQPVNQPFAAALALAAVPLAAGLFAAAGSSRAGRFARSFAGRLGIAAARLSVATGGLSVAASGFGTAATATAVLQAQHAIQKFKTEALGTQGGADNQRSNNHVPFHRATSPLHLGLGQRIPD
jgi:hypothetical protein